MKQRFKCMGSIWAASLWWAQTSFAQDSGAMVSSFNGLLIGVSALLVAVRFVFVMVKFAHLIDVVSDRLSSRREESSQRKD